MPKEIFKRIVAVEENANNVIENAGKAAIQIKLEAKERAKELIENARKTALSQVKELLAGAETEAKKEAINIDSKTTLEIANLRNNSTSKIKEAKKLCQ